MNAAVSQLHDEAWKIVKAAERLEQRDAPNVDVAPVRQALIAIACRLGDTGLLGEYNRRAETRFHNLMIELTDDAELVLAVAGAVPRPLSPALLYLKGLQLWNAVGRNETEVSTRKDTGLALMLLGRRLAPPASAAHSLEALAREALMNDIALREYLPRLEEAFARALADAHDDDAPVRE